MGPRRHGSLKLFVQVKISEDNGATLGWCATAFRRSRGAQTLPHNLPHRTRDLQNAALAWELVAIYEYQDFSYV